jgi:hypothetical protein
MGKTFSPSSGYGGDYRISDFTPPNLKEQLPVGGRRIWTMPSQSNVACATDLFGFVGAFLLGLFFLCLRGVRLSYALLGCYGTL